MLVFQKLKKKAIFKKPVPSTTRSQPGELSHSEKAWTGYAGIKIPKRHQPPQTVTQEEPAFNRGPTQHQAFSTQQNSSSPLKITDISRNPTSLIDPFSI